MKSLFQDKKGIAKKIEGTVTTVVFVVVLFTVVAALLPTLFASGDAIQQSLGGTFGQFFKTGGLLWILLAASLFIGGIIYVMNMFKPKGGGY